MQPTFVDSFSRKVSLVAKSTALVIVDMQNATGNRNMGLGAMLAAKDGGKSSDYRFTRIEQIVVPTIKRLADHFRGAGAKVVYVTYGSNVPDGSDLPTHIEKIVKATNNVAGQPEHNIVDGLTPEPGELILNKTTMGAFRSTGIDSHLRAMGIETVVMTGVSTNNCVAMTAMEACDSQYGVVIVSDGTGTDSEEMQNATLTMLQRLWARVMTADEVIGELS